jgi:hypothetical protein
MRSNLTAMLWKNTQDVHILTITDRPQRDGNFYEEHEKAQKPINVTHSSWHMGYIDKWGKMANSYSISQRAWK